MGLFLLQIKQLAKATQICGGRQQLDCISKVHPNIGANGRHLVAALFHFWPALCLKEVRHEITLQQNVIITGAATKKRNFFFS